MGNVWMVLISAATSVVLGMNPSVMLAAQQAGRAGERTDKGLYVLKVVEPGYDVTVKEIERAPRYSVLEMTGLVPTITAGGVVLFRAMHDIAKERGFDTPSVLRRLRGNRPRREGEGAMGE